jgi:hypothetical protein
VALTPAFMPAILPTLLVLVSQLIIGKTSLAKLLRLVTQTIILQLLQSYAFILVVQRYAFSRATRVPAKSNAIR